MRLQFEPGSGRAYNAGMKNETELDLLIVGGGMVGATLACLLQPLNIRVGLVDRGEMDSSNAPFRQPEPQFDARVSAISPASRALFESIDVWSEVVVARHCPYQRMQVWDADGSGAIDFDAAELQIPELGSIVENSVLNAALWQRLQEIDNLQLIPGAEIAQLRSLDADDAVVLTTTAGDSIRASLVIAADGANSRIRELANFKTREWDYGQHAIVTTVRTERAHGHSARQRFLDTGPLALLPLAAADGDEHWVSIVWSTLPQRAQELLAMADDDFCRQLGLASEHRLGRILGCDRRFGFPLRQRHAIKYWQPRLALIGDAAHTIHPLAGQGVNLGFQDALALAEELRSGMAAGRQLTDPVLLQRYQRRRMGANLGMMGVMEGFKRLFGAEALPLRWLRNAGMQTVNRTDKVKNALARHAMGLDHA